MPNRPGLEAVSPPPASVPRKAAPRYACDTHAHVFGPYDIFPFVTAPSYAPPLAPFELYSAMQDRIGISRGILVQPAPYGSDNRALTDALLRGAGKLRGIAVADSSVSNAELIALDRAGIRGLRFNEMIDSGTGSRFKGSVGITHLPKLAPRMKELGWHAQIWAQPDDVPSLAREVTGLGLEVVFEHMGGIRADSGTCDPRFQDIVKLLADERIWVKLSLCRSSESFPNYEDLRPFHDSLIEANPNRVLWGSDWPFVRMTDTAPDVGHLFDLFEQWVNDDSVEHRILVENPQTLYRFE
jgi:2-pyrone-4,6-dicarboxylate lactonase